jgi:hypothetical protein
MSRACHVAWQDAAHATPVRSHLLHECLPVQTEHIADFKQMASELGSSQGSSMSHMPSGGGVPGKDGHREESLSPPPRWPHHRDGGRHVVERVVEKKATGIMYLMLMRTNYTEWSLVMCINLQAVGLWEAHPIWRS